MRQFAVLDIDHETGITVIGSVAEVAAAIFFDRDRSREVVTVELTRVYWNNPNAQDGDDEWDYDESPVFVRPSAVRAVSGLPSRGVLALEEARVEAG